MDKITATKVYEEELREMEFKRIEKIIENYDLESYKPEATFLSGTIFTFLCLNNDSVYFITHTTKDKVYY